MGSLNLYAYRPKAEARYVVGRPQYALPFKPGMKVIELGGGANPSFRPNVDVRWLPQVDQVCDFNHPLPLPSSEYHGLYASYVLEHLSWRKVRQFIGECHRILKPGGVAVFITANLWEQCRALTQAPEWNDDLICMLFGDQDYSDNTHRCGVSPEYATRLFLDEGFHEVTVYPHPQAVTDMILEARKSHALIEL